MAVSTVRRAFHDASVDDFCSDFAYSVSSEQLSKVDLATGTHKDITIIGSTQASPAVGGSSIFLSTKSKLITFDLDLNTIANFSLAGGFSSPAVGADGQVYVGATDGSFFLFPGF
jgi:outer membrane protein assembly factor BamB